LHSGSCGRAGHSDGWLTREGKEDPGFPGEGTAEGFLVEVTTEAEGGIVGGAVSVAQDTLKSEGSGESTAMTIFSNSMN